MGLARIEVDRRATEGASTSIGIYTVSNRTGTFVVKRRYEGNGREPSVARRSKAMTTRPSENTAIEGS